MFPDPIFPSPYISQSLSSPHKVRLCCSVSTFPSLFAPKSYVLQPLYSPLPTFPRNGFPSLCSPKTFPSSYKCSAPRSLYYPGPFKLFFSPDVLNCYQSICSPKMPHSPYAPRHIPQSQCSSELENTTREHKDCGTSLGIQALESISCEYKLWT